MFRLLLTVLSILSFSSAWDSDVIKAIELNTIAVRDVLLKLINIQLMLENSFKTFPKSSEVESFIQSVVPSLQDLSKSLTTTNGLIGATELSIRKQIQDLDVTAHSMSDFLGKIHATAAQSATRDSSYQKDVKNVLEKLQSSKLYDQMTQLSENLVAVKNLIIKMVANMEKHVVEDRLKQLYDVTFDNYKALTTISATTVKFQTTVLGLSASVSSIDSNLNLLKDSFNQHRSVVSDYLGKIFSVLEKISDTITNSISFVLDRPVDLSACVRNENEKFECGKIRHSRRRRGIFSSPVEWIEESLKSIITTVFSLVEKLFVPFFEVLLSFVAKIVEAVVEAWVPLAAKVLKSILDNLSDIFFSVFDAAGNFTEDFVKTLIRILTAVLLCLLNLIGKLPKIVFSQIFIMILSYIITTKFLFSLIISMFAYASLTFQ